MQENRLEAALPSPTSLRSEKREGPGAWRANTPPEAKAIRLALRLLASLRSEKREGPEAWRASTPLLDKLV
jgi:hypothetical protein